MPKDVAGVGGRPRKPADAIAGKAFMEIVWGDRYDLSTEHFGKTPERFVKMLRELTNKVPFDFTTFQSPADEMIVIKDIDFVSLCAHHIVPFMGRCHIAYVPRGKIAGLSKFARTVKTLSRDLTVQEELTNNIADFLEEKLNPLGLGVIMEAEHLCMTIRGVQSPGTMTITSSMRGVFADHTRLARTEFLNLIRRDRG